MVLSVTAGLSVSIYVVFNLRLGILREQLETSGLISRSSLERAGLTDFLESGRPRSRHEALENTVLIVLSVVGSAAMYYWLYTQGPIFRDLAGSYTHMGSTGSPPRNCGRTGGPTTPRIPSTPRSGSASARSGCSSRSSSAPCSSRSDGGCAGCGPRPVPVDFVPKWLDRDYGWRPVSGLVTLGYLAIFTFLASFSARCTRCAPTSPACPGCCPSYWE
jgi:hypothetical protein